MDKKKDANINSLEDKYSLVSKIGSGSFGEVYLSEYKKNKKLCAIKVEERKPSSRIHEEYRIYKKLRKNGVNQGIPLIFEYIETPKYNILVMELLGKSLDELFVENNNLFDLTTVLKLSVEIINLLKLIHDAGFIHRDIKPNNFLVGYKEQNNKLFIMDFGLSKQHTSNNTHINITMDRSLVGTARYASTNVHMGIEPSRRDDLESVGYMLVYFLIGKLPWQGLKTKKRDGEKVSQIELIGETKMCTNINKICYGLPDCFSTFINYCKTLEFEQKPDYTYINKLFHNQINISNIELRYIWE